MSVRSHGYDNENLDKVFCYFMRVILHLQKSGVEDLPLENNLPSPYKSFLDTAMEIFLSATTPELARLILEAGYSCAGVPLFRRNGYRQSSGRKPLFRNRDTALN